MAVNDEPETPTTESIADALGVEVDTIRDCLERDLKLTVAHLIAFTDLDDDAIDDQQKQEIEQWFKEYAWREFVTDRSESGYLIDTAEKSERLRLLRCPICGTDWFRMWADQVPDPLAKHLNEEHDAGDLAAPDEIGTRYAGRSRSDR